MERHDVISKELENLLKKIPDNGIIPVKITLKPAGLEVVVKPGQKVSSNILPEDRRQIDSLKEYLDKTDPEYTFFRKSNYIIASLNHNQIYHLIKFPCIQQIDNDSPFF